jgi:hypothetical protein
MTAGSAASIAPKDYYHTLRRWHNGPPINGVPVLAVTRSTCITHREARITVRRYGYRAQWECAPSLWRDGYWWSCTWESNGLSRGEVMAEVWGSI